MVVKNSIFWDINQARNQHEAGTGQSFLLHADFILVISTTL
jgi:hypothetical protein